MKTKKKCSICKKLLPLSNFPNDISNKTNGKSGRCFSCNKKYCKEYQHTHKEKYILSKRNWVIKNPIKDWADRTIRNHRRNGFTVYLLQKELIKKAEETTHCPLCGCKLRYLPFKGHQYNTASLDRINNEKHIDVNNMWIICRECNAMKGRKPMREYVEYCRTIVNKYDGGEL